MFGNRRDDQEEFFVDAAGLGVVGSISSRLDRNFEGPEVQLVATGASDASERHFYLLPSRGFGNRCALCRRCSSSEEGQNLLELPVAEVSSPHKNGRDRIWTRRSFLEMRVRCT